MSDVHIWSTDRIRFELGNDPLEIRRLVHLPSGRTVVEGARQRFLVRPPLQVSDPVFLRNAEWLPATPDGPDFFCCDESGRYRADVRLETDEDGIRFHIRLTSPDPSWMVEWSMEGVSLSEVIIPALGGQVLTTDTPPDKRLAYKYPFWWNAQFVVGSLGDEGGIWMRTMESEPHFKVFRVQKQDSMSGRFKLGFGFEADAPLRSNELEATWWLDGYSGGWQNPAERHRRWLEKAFGLVSCTEHPHLPEWARDINFILEIWGMRKDLGEPAHMFEMMIDRLDEFARLHPPEQTLLYLPGFAEEGIDSRIPSYHPSEKLGGREAFGLLVNAAHAYGYRVMIHTNILGMTFTHPEFPRFARHQVCDPFGQVLGWGLDIDGDWLAEPHFAYINPGVPEWGDLMVRTLGELIESFALDAVFLDQTLLAFNDSRGPNFVKGMRTHVRRLQEAYPGVLFAGEGIHEQVLPVLPFNQVHGIDSLAEVHGSDGLKPWRKAHPVSSYVFTPYTRLVAHLLTQHPSSAVFRFQENTYAQLDVMPALVLYSQAQKIDTPETRAMIERAKAMTQKGARTQEIKD